MRNRLKICAALIWFLPSYTAYADSDPLTFRGWLQWLNVVELTTVNTEASINPENQILQIPNRSMVSLFRPNLKVTASNVQFIARPRVIYRSDTIKVNDHEGVAKSTTLSYFNDAFMQWTISDSVSMAYGLQCYQWGAAETLSPSNRLFHDIASNRNVRYEVRGKNIARVNFSLGKEFSAVVMADMKEDKDAPLFSADTPWTPTIVAKGEYSWSGGADYFGLVVGGQANGFPWVGEYFSVGMPFFDGISVFGDASQQRGADVWYPVAKLQQTPVGPRQQVTFEKTAKASKRVYNLAVVGLKYDFVNGAILRGEYVYNEAGYTQSQRDLALAGLSPASPLQQSVLGENLRRFFSPNLDVPGQRYAYTSIHVPDFLSLTDFILGARTVYSLTDHSSSSYFSLDYKVNDGGTLTVAVGGGAGKKDGELKGYSAPTEYLAYRHDW